jgi:hypothetical protein
LHPDWKNVWRGEPQKTGGYVYYKVQGMRFVFLEAKYSQPKRPAGNLSQAAPTRRTLKKQLSFNSAGWFVTIEIKYAQSNFHKLFEYPSVFTE